MAPVDFLLRLLSCLMLIAASGYIGYKLGFSYSSYVITKKLCAVLGNDGTNELIGKLTVYNMKHKGDDVPHEGD